MGWFFPSFRLSVFVKGGRLVGLTWFSRTEIGKFFASNALGVCVAVFEFQFLLVG